LAKVITFGILVWEIEDNKEAVPETWAEASESIIHELAFKGLRNASSWQNIMGEIGWETLTWDILDILH